MQQQKKQQPEHPVERECREKTETTVNRSRRKALKTIATGTAAAGAMALTGKWSKPVVDTIILPAHAQATNGAAPVGTTSPAPTTTSGECSPTIVEACIHAPLNDAGYIESAEIGGGTNPTQAGITIQGGFRSNSPTNGTHTYTFQMTTDNRGFFHAIQNFTVVENVTSIDAGWIQGPCGTNDIGLCSDMQNEQ